MRMMTAKMIIPESLPGNGKGRQGVVEEGVLEVVDIRGDAVVGGGGVGVVGVGVVGLEVGVELLKGFEVRGRCSGGTRRRHLS